MSAPRLSVIIPTRNCLEWLPRAMASALAVPVDGLEVIIVDDGSTDGTAAFLATAEANGLPIRVLRRTGGEGAAAARNAGLAVARAPVVGFLDADDIWQPDRIAERLAWHKAHPETALSFGEYETLYADNRREPRLIGYMPRFAAAVAPPDEPWTGDIGWLGAGGAGLVYGENPVCTSVVLASRAAVEAVGAFDVSLGQAEDWDLWIRLALHGPVAYAPRPQGLHMHRADSLSSEVRAGCLAVATVLDRYAGAIRARDAGAWRCGRAFVAEARAELAEEEGRRLAHLGWQARAWFWQPSRRRWRSCLRAAVHAVVPRGAVRLVARAA
ncbi:glycosyltransferase family 2 protein [Sediminicoccus sp. BL-A-41-H5]|uniref:glycosyltransferase family 2 protein n=1 Tax=Sediminicoccus sp. BL-A-41-H5 TaxID=3421106 RepID=UPI003D6780FA